MKITVTSRFMFGRLSNFLLKAHLCGSTIHSLKNRLSYFAIFGLSGSSYGSVLDKNHRALDLGKSSVIDDGIEYVSGFF